MHNGIEKVIIIGSGPASLTAAIYASRAHLQPLVIEGPNPGGQLMGTSIVENWPGNTSIMGPHLMQTMKEHAKHLGTRFLSSTITQLEGTESPFTLITNRNEKLQTQTIIIATGATPKRLHIPGEQTYWGKGVTVCAVCDGTFFKDKPVIIVGGGDTAMEDASFMTKFTNNITIIQILPQLTASAAMQERVLNHPGIKIIYETAVNEIIGDGQKVTGVKITNQKTQQRSQLQTDAVFVAIGLTPNTALFKGHLALQENGYITVTNNTQTSVTGIFAAGDAVDARYRQAITSAGFGCMAALDTERWLRLQQALTSI